VIGGRILVIALLDRHRRQTDQVAAGLQFSWYFPAMAQLPIGGDRWAETSILQTDAKLFR
jgi:hypothetical protein